MEEVVPSLEGCVAVRNLPATTTPGLEARAVAESAVGEGRPPRSAAAQTKPPAPHVATLSGASPAPERREQDLNPSQAQGQGSRRTEKDRPVCARGTVRTTQTESSGPLGGEETGGSPFAPQPHQGGASGPPPPHAVVGVVPDYAKPRPFALRTCVSTGGALDPADGYSRQGLQHCLD